MHFRIQGFSFIELMLCLLVLSIGLSGFLTLQKHSIQLTNQQQYNTQQQTHRTQCLELTSPTSPTC